MDRSDIPAGTVIFFVDFVCVCGNITDMNVLRTEERRTMKIKVNCPECGSSQVLAKRSDGNSWCRRCGWQGDTELTKHTMPRRERTNA